MTARATDPDLRGEAVLEGVRPTRGMWLCHPKRKRCYAQIVRVRRDGALIVIGSYGVQMAHHPSSLYGHGYEYHAERPAGDGWLYLVDCVWTEKPPANWPHHRSAA